MYKDQSSHQLASTRLYFYNLVFSPLLIDLKCQTKPRKLMKSISPLDYKIPCAYFPYPSFHYVSIHENRNMVVDFQFKPLLKNLRANDEKFWQKFCLEIF